MPICINLLAEQIAEEEARRKDPVKRAYWIAGVLISLVAIYSLSLQLKAWLASEQLNRQDILWNQKQTNYTEVIQTRNQTTAIEGKLASLHRLTTNRFLSGPVLESLQFAFVGVDNVRLTRITMNQSFSPEVRAVGEKKTPVTNVTERATLTLEGFVSGNVSAAQVDFLMSNLLKTPYFSRLKDSKAFNLKEFTPKPDPNDNTQSIGTFIIECVFPPITRVP